MSDLVGLFDVLIHCAPPTNIRENQDQHSGRAPEERGDLYLSAKRVEDCWDTNNEPAEIAKPLRSAQATK